MVKQKFQGLKFLYLSRKYSGFGDAGINRLVLLKPIFYFIKSFDKKTGYYRKGLSKFKMLLPQLGWHKDQNGTAFFIVVGYFWWKCL